MAEHCKGCRHNWDNMGEPEARREGHCYMFLDEMPNCQVWRPPNRNGTKKSTIMAAAALMAIEMNKLKK